MVQLSSTLSPHRSRPGALRMHGMHVLCRTLTFFKQVYNFPESRHLNLPALSCGQMLRPTMQLVGLVLISVLTVVEVVVGVVAVRGGSGGGGERRSGKSSSSSNRRHAPPRHH